MYWLNATRLCRNWMIHWYTCFEYFCFNTIFHLELSNWLWVDNSVMFTDCLEILFRLGVWWWSSSPSSLLVVHLSLGKFRTILDSITHALVKLFQLVIHSVKTNAMHIALSFSKVFLFADKILDSFTCCRHDEYFICFTDVWEWWQGQHQTVFSWNKMMEYY